MFGRKKKEPEPIYDVTQKIAKTWQGGTKLVPTTKSEQRKMKAEILKRNPKAIALDSKAKKQKDLEWIDRIEEFDVVPPLEGFWWQEGVDGIYYGDKSTFHWISVIRLPEFVNKKDFDWAVEEAARKKKLDCSLAEFLTIEEGLCVQIMHIGPFDHEPSTVALMDQYIAENGYANDMNENRLHHEIYLSDARKVAPEKWKTIIRHPIRTQ